MQISAIDVTSVAIAPLAHSAQSTHLFFWHSHSRPLTPSYQRALYPFCWVRTDFLLSYITSHHTWPPIILICIYFLRYPLSLWIICCCSVICTYAYYQSITICLSGPCLKWTLKLHFNFECTICTMCSQCHSQFQQSARQWYIIDSMVSGLGWANLIRPPTVLFRRAALQSSIFRLPYPPMVIVCPTGIVPTCLVKHTTALISISCLHFLTFVVLTFSFNLVLPNDQIMHLQNDECLAFYIQSQHIISTLIANLPIAFCLHLHSYNNYVSGLLSAEYLRLLAMHSLCVQLMSNLRQTYDHAFVFDHQDWSWYLYNSLYIM